MPTTFRIKHLSGSLAGRTQKIALDEGQAIRLGRNTENDVKFTDAGDDNVSGVHAELVWQDGRLHVEDKKSTNGTFVNGSRCPAFERLAVPDGARIRLAQDGPEMEVTFAPAAVAAVTAGEASAPPKAAVGRETLLREIDRAKQEGRDHTADEVTRSRRSNRLWLTAASVALGVLVLAGVWVANRTNAMSTETARADLEESVGKKLAENVWLDVEKRTRPAVGHVRLRYHLNQTILHAGQRITKKVLPQEFTGSAVLIKPGLVITAKHVAEPWKYLTDWEKTEYRDWDDFAEKNHFEPVYELLEIQFPGRQAVTATHFASAETNDLALLTIPEMAIEPIDVEFANESVNVTEDVAIIGYPYAQGELHLVATDVSYGQSSLTLVKDMEPTFLKGTVSRPVHEIGETSHYFFLDASIEPGNSGGPVLNDEGKVVGIISMGLEIGDTITFNDQTYPTVKEVESAGRAVSPGDIADFLHRTGVL